MAISLGFFHFCIKPKSMSLKKLGKFIGFGYWREFTRKMENGDRVAIRCSGASSGYNRRTTVNGKDLRVTSDGYVVQKRYLHVRFSVTSVRP